MSSKAKFTFIPTTGDDKGKEVSLSDTLVPFATRILGFAQSSNTAQVKVETSNRGIAEAFVDLRSTFKYVPRKVKPASALLHTLSVATLERADVDISASMNDKGRYVLPASDIDWLGKSPACSKAEEEIWLSVLGRLNLQAWLMATSLSPADHPMRAAVEHHIDKVTKERLGNDAVAYVLATGKIFESPGTERKEALKALKADSEEGSSTGGETDQSEEEKAKTENPAVSQLTSILSVVTENLASKGLRGKVRLEAHNLARSIINALEVFASETKPADVKPVDKRRARAADATAA